MKKLLVGMLLLPLLGCASIETDPAPKPDPLPDPPIFRRCQTCEEVECVTVWFGHSDCKSGEDDQGKFCIAQGSCTIGTFGAASVPLQDEGELPVPDAEVLAAQSRVNDFLRRNVVETLASCWSDLDGEGTVTIEHEYIRREGGDWVPFDLRAVHSTLPGGQREFAERCMRRAVEGAFLPGDGDEREMLLIWTWAVPLPDSSG